jgi:hypothetical protein
MSNVSLKSPGNSCRNEPIYVHVCVYVYVRNVRARVWAVFSLYKDLDIGCCRPSCLEVVRDGLIERCRCVHERTGKASPN